MMHSTRKEVNIQAVRMSLSTLCPGLFAIVETFLDAGAIPYLVGGAVRDLMFGLPIHDIDIEIHGITAELMETILRRFGHVDYVGVSFGVWRVHGLPVDWSLPRIDSSGRHPSVTVDPYMGITNALRRRDLTINAMAINLHDCTLVDPFGGTGDYERGLLRATDPTFFVEDPLRLYRVMQAIGRFSLYPDKNLNDMCRSMNLRAVSNERISDEFEKLLLKSREPSRGFRWLRDIGRLHELLPELAATIGVEQDPVWHPEGDVFDHTMIALDYAAGAVYEDAHEKLVICLAVLCHDLGKVATTSCKSGRWRSYGHDEAGVAPARALLRRITIKRYLDPVVCMLVRHHMAVFDFSRSSASLAAYKRLARAMAPYATIAMLVAVARADSHGKWLTSEAFLARALEATVAHGAEEPILKGRDLIDVIAPGPLLGEYLKRAYDLQIDGHIHDRDKLRELVLEEYYASRSRES